MKDWKKIKCAPTKPGSRVIIYSPSITEGYEGHVGEAFLGKDGEWYWTGLDDSYFDPINETNGAPTHWMPMPEIPSKCVNLPIKEMTWDQKFKQEFGLTGKSFVGTEGIEVIPSTDINESDLEEVRVIVDEFYSRMNK